MRIVPPIKISRTVEIYLEMLSCRREYCADTEFFKMPDFWESLSNGSEKWSINRFRSNLGEDYRKKAAVVSFDDRVTLTVDEELWDRAAKGCKFANFILAHEIGHLALNHHARNAVTKNFQLFAGPRGMSNLPPTAEEKEANLAAVFFQCGVALENNRWVTKDLANRAYCEIGEVKKAQVIVRLDEFKRERIRQKVLHPRVIF